MSTTYKIKLGDTLEIISRKVYGVETFAGLISSANPGLRTLQTGIDIFVPENDETKLIDLAQVSTVANKFDEVGLLINNVRFRFWTDLTITRQIDSFDQASFSLPFDSDNALFRANIIPFSYFSVVVTVGGSPLFTGSLLDVRPNVNPMSKTVQISCYSKPGVLNDCCAPASYYADGVGRLESTGQTLEDVAKSICQPFGILTQFEVSSGGVFERVKLERDQIVLTFLTKLAKERNLIMTSSSTGALVFWQSEDVGSPVATLTQGESPLMDITGSFHPQDFYSHVTGIQPPLIGLVGAQYTVKTIGLEGVLRPFTFEADDTQASDLKLATEAKAGRMMANMVSYSAAVSTWESKEGVLWTPNTTVRVIAPDAMIYNAYEFLIRSVTFERTATSRMAVLDLILPGSMSGKFPDRLPWQ